jgi:hypothetical protein
MHLWDLLLFTTCVRVRPSMAQLCPRKVVLLVHGLPSRLPPPSGSTRIATSMAMLPGEDVPGDDCCPRKSWLSMSL